MTRDHIRESWTASLFILTLLICFKCTTFLVWLVISAQGGAPHSFARHLIQTFFGEQNYLVNESEDIGGISAFEVFSNVGYLPCAFLSLFMGCILSGRQDWTYHGFICCWNQLAIIVLT